MKIKKHLIKSVIVAMLLSLSSALVFVSRIETPVVNHAGSAINSPQVQITPLNSRTTDLTSEVRAYPSGSEVKFKIDIANGKTGDYLSNTVIVYYRTYDITAVSNSSLSDVNKDYTPVDNYVTFEKNSTTLSYDVTVKVGTSTYAVYQSCYINNNTRASCWDYDLDDIVYTNGIMGGQRYSDPSQVGYNTRSFGIEIYKVVGGSVYTTADSKTGKNIEHNTALGTINASHYLPYYTDGDLHILEFWDQEHTISIDDISMPRGSVDYKKVDIKGTKFGAKFSNDYIQTGLGHYYYCGSCLFCGPDVSQRNAQAGLIYDGWETLTKGNADTKMSEQKMGVVVYEEDGYPAKNYVNFGTYRDDRYCGKVDNNVKYSGDTWQFEKYRTEVTNSIVSTSYDDDWRKVVFAYKVNGDPEWLGMSGRRYKYGEDRKLKECRLEIFQRDDSPITLVDCYPEDTSVVNKSQDDTIKLIVRFSEPVQIVGTKMPELICSLNLTTITTRDDKRAVKFKYLTGSGSDTLTFECPLKDIASTNKISAFTLKYMNNAESICDFSNTEGIHMCGLKDGSITYDASSATALLTTKTGGQWNLKMSYPDGVLVSRRITLNKEVDPRSPKIKKIECKDATTSAKVHQVTITLDETDIDTTIYAHWTNDLNGATSAQIPRPTEYSESEIIHEGTGGLIKTSAELDGTVYLWIKVVSDYGKVDERVCGPFYFDKTADDISNIRVVSGEFSSPTPTKTIAFDIDHSTDYYSASGLDITDTDNHRIGIAQLDMIYGSTNVWNSDTTLYQNKALFLYSTPQRRGLEASFVEEEMPVYNFSYSSENMSTQVAPVTTDSFLRTLDGKVVTKKYVTKVTYTINIGYLYDSDNDLVVFNDFNIDPESYAKVYFGFVVYDGNGNSKNYKTQLTAGKDYINNEYAYFETRSIISSDIIYKSNGDPDVDVLTYASSSESTIDKTINAYIASKPVSIEFDFSKDELGMLLSDKKDYYYQLVVKKPNTTLSATEFTRDGEKFENGIYYSPYTKDGGTIETHWFSYSLSDKTLVDSANQIYRYNKLTINTKNIDTCEDICGYYDISIIYTDNNQLVAETKKTDSATFFLGTGYDSTQNLMDVENGKLLINRIYRLDEGIQYYYQSNEAVPTIFSESYANGSSVRLAFSSKERAEAYLEYMEYRDFYLYKIETDEDAEALKSGQGKMVRSKADLKDADVPEPAVGQYWIRYKSANWTLGDKASTSWVYYYYTNEENVTSINITKLRSNIKDAVDSVVNTILEGYFPESTTYSKTETLTSIGGLDKYGSPTINVKALKYEPESTDVSNCGTKFATLLQYSGDSAIYEATVTLYEDNKSVDYKLASNSIIKVTGSTNVYITPASGPYLGYYGKVPEGNTKPLKTIIDEVYTQMRDAYNAANGIASSSSTAKATAPSGLYIILEIDQNGISYTTVYVDKDAPQANFEYKIRATDENGNKTEVVADQNYMTINAVDKTINCVEFTITGIGELNAPNGYAALEEVDKYAYIAVLNGSRSKVEKALTVKDLEKEAYTISKEGKYYLQVYDRSGNYFEILVNIVTSEMAVKINTENDVVVNISGRNVDQIKDFEVLLNDKVIDTKFETSKRYTENGKYTIYILDWYGGEYRNEFVYTRPTPVVSFLVNTSNGFAKIGKATENAFVEQTSAVSYNVSANDKVGFRFDKSLRIGVEFITVGEKDNFNISESSSMLYTQKVAESFSVRFYYIDYPNIYSTYNVVLDVTAPIIQVSYETYSFIDNGEADALRKLQERIKNGDSLENGEEIVPSRVDYSLSSVETVYISDGSYVNTSKASVKLNDVSGISRITINHEGRVIYDGVYVADGSYEDGVNHNVFTESGIYKISAYDVLYNKSSFNFSISKTYDIEYFVDGEKITVPVDYIYETDPLTNEPLVDEEGNKIVKEEWRFLTKFTNPTSSSDDNRGGKDGDEDVALEDNEYTFVKYGNTSFKLRLAQGAEVSYLFTSEDKKGLHQYFIGFIYENNEIYLYKYVVDIDEDIISLGKEVADTPIVTRNETGYDRKTVLTTIDDLEMTITVEFTSKGYVEFEVLTSTVDDNITTIETKVASNDGIYEPGYYKTTLSKSPTNINIYNEEGIVNAGQYGTGEWIYTHGNKLFIIEDELSKYVSDVMISYSTSMSANKYKYLYSTSEVSEKDMYTAFDGDGYYIIKVTNVFGISRDYRFAMSNSLLVTTIAYFEDGWTREYGSKYEDAIYANSRVEVTFREDRIAVVRLLKDGVEIDGKPETINGAIRYTLEDEATYVLYIEDDYANSVTRNIAIKHNVIDLPSDCITGFNKDALKRSENYTNTKTTISTYFFDSKQIKYVSIIHDGIEKILYDDISSNELRVPYGETAFIQAIGLDGDGSYEIIFRDIYGNLASESVVYSGTDTLQLFRLTKAGHTRTEFAIEDALNPEINFISNKDLYFQSDSSKYVFKINGEDVVLPYSLSFATSSGKEIEYSVYYQDEYGYKYSFKAVLFKADLFVKESDGVKINVVDGLNVTTRNFTVDFSETGWCQYTINDGDTVYDYERGTILKLDGNYIFTVEDIAGNVAYYQLRKDSIVEFAFTEGKQGDVIENGFITSSKNIVFESLNDDQAKITSAFVNGKLVNPQSDGVYDYSTNGKWEFLIKDVNGNETTFVFYVISHKINQLLFKAPKDYEFSDIWFTSEETGRIPLIADIEKDETGVYYYDFKQAGTYSIIINSLVTGKAVNFAFEVSTDMPTATLENVSDGGATINVINFVNTKKGDTFYVYDYETMTLLKTYTTSMDNEIFKIEDEGKYVVVCENLEGNKTTYTITKKHVANAAGSALIIIVILGVIVGLMIGLFYRKKSKVDK